MLYPIKVVDIELSKPIETITGLQNYLGLQGLVRLHSIPIGYIHVPVTEDRVEASILSKEILEKHSSDLILNLLKNGIASTTRPKELRLENLYNLAPLEQEGILPLVTVAVCTRDRAEDLALCLDALSALDYPQIDIIVIDNAPKTKDTATLVQNHYPSIRYVHEPRPGLDWARNRAIQEAKGEIIAFTDDDVIVDKKWVIALACLFSEHPEIMAATGLVVPYELETEAQVLFEKYNGFGRGFKRKWHQVKGKRMPWGLLGTGQFGTGANMAFRREIFDRIGYFDPALDVGTVTNGGGDLEMFFRVLKEGYMLVYEPSAIVRHRHRPELSKLKIQLANNSKGLVSYIARSIKAYPEEKKSFFKLWWWVVRNWNLKRLLSNYLCPSSFPRDLILAEFRGCFTSNRLYQQARKNSILIAGKYGAEKDVDIDQSKKDSRNQLPSKKAGIAIRSINLCEPLQPIQDISDYAAVRVFARWNDISLGQVDISNPYTQISKSRLAEEIIHQIGFSLLKLNSNLDERFQHAEALAILAQQLESTNKNTANKLSTVIDVSIVVATFDRPDDLRKCLRHLVALETTRNLEIIVVDNNPISGLTPPVVAEFMDIILVQESRKGLSYARNAGINASKGSIIISTDDDVIVPPDWVENLIIHFNRPDVMIVTGNVLPLELENTPQQYFEMYGGLGRGFEKREYNEKWFESFMKLAVPTWKIGACANAAFRASIFAHPEIGMIDETLGAGTPTGCSEDTYVFYKVLKLGYTIVYEPKAYVWHKHRTNMKAFRRQLYNYSKGHVAYHLKTWLEHNDLKGLIRIMVELPKIHLKSIFRRLTGRSHYPISMTLLEIRGNLAGPWALFTSTRQVKKKGKSTPFTLIKNDFPDEMQRHPSKQTDLVTTIQIEDPD